MASYTHNVKRTAAAKAAERKAKDLGLTLTSAWRSSERDKAVGGTGRGYHVLGQAYDVAGNWSAMDKFAKWAKDSGMFRSVLWQVSGHYDHVHVSWFAGGSTEYKDDHNGYIDLGDAGDYVEVVQRLIDGIKVDGLFGPKTKEAVKDFQEETGITVDGIVGPETWNKLTAGAGKLFS